MKQEGMRGIGKYAFLAAMGLTVLAGFIPQFEVSWIVVLLGVVVSVANIQAKETTNMVLWTIGMGVFGIGALASSIAGIPAVGSVLSAIITNIGLFFTVIAGVFLLKIGYKMFST